MLEKLPVMLLASLAGKKGPNFWLLVQVVFTGPRKELKNMTAHFLHLEAHPAQPQRFGIEILWGVQTFHLRNVHFIRQNWGFVLDNVGEYLPTFLAQMKAIIYVKSQDKRCFG